MLKKCILAIVLGLCASFYGAQSITINNASHFPVTLDLFKNCSGNPDKFYEGEMLEPGEFLEVETPISSFRASITYRSECHITVESTAGHGADFHDAAIIILKNDAFANLTYSIS